MEPSTQKARWRDRVKETIKEREIQKTIVTHWSAHKETYLVTALCVAGTYLVTKKSTSSMSFRQFSLYGGNSLVISMKEEE